MIQLTNISLHFGAHLIFDKITLTFKPGEKIGLVGRNGSGKSTLLKVIFGELKPQTGQIDIPSSYRVGYLAQKVDLDDSLSPRHICGTAFEALVEIENELESVQSALESSTNADEQIKLSGKLSALYERLGHMGAEQVDEDVEKVLKGMGFKESEMDEPISNLSGGWKMRVELARLLLARPELLLLDEPTNHLDIESILWFESYLQTYEGVVIVVSHDQHVLDSVTKRTLEISNGSMTDIPYSYLKAMAKKRELDENLSAAYENQQRLIAHKERLINKFRAKASKAKFAKSLQTELNRMDVIEVEGQDGKTMRLRFAEGSRAGRVVYGLKGMDKSYGDLHVIRGLNLVIERGERIAFVGQNGQGKTTLARILAGAMEESGGEMKPGHQLEINYYAQNQTDLLEPKKTILETLTQHAPAETVGRLRSILGSLLFEGDEVTKKVSVLSGGERARLSFACMTMDACNVLILDEPTNHLDIPSKEILKNALLQYKGALIVVSHDMEFLRGLTEHTLEFRDGKIIKHLFGIEEFLERRKIENLRQLEKRAVPVSSPKVAVVSDNKMREELRKNLRNLERQIEKLERKKENLEQQMGATDFYVSPDSERVMEEYRALSAALEKKMESWEDAISKFDEV